MIKEILQKNDWTTKPDFLQSWEYGDLLKNNGKNVVRYELQNNEGTWQFQGVITSLLFGLKFFYVARVDLNKEAILEINKFLQENNYTFWRVELLSKINLQEINYINVKNRQPEHSWILDLNKSEEKILQEMHSKTRYNIKLASKRGVTSKMEKNIDKYWQLNEMTSKRNDIKSHEKNYLSKLLEMENVYQLNTYLGNEILSSTILLKYNERMFYLFGASSNKHRNLMAPYLNQFEAIKFAKENNCKFYDFWGIAPPAEKGSNDADSHHNYTWKKENSLAGVAKFKAGFNGQLVSYPKALEIILQPFKYNFFSFLQKLRKLKKLSINGL
ncbi:MAG: peptidoglycan bridge formation glycyltransferase FemA/FemB family protein [Candidatus Magasanikbacteria bacterium]